jgi:hypothetical protein
MPYEVICKHCNFTKYAKDIMDFSSIRCNKCNSLRFGLIKYTWISEEDYKQKIKENNK